MLKNKKDIKNLVLLLGVFAIVLVLTTRFSYIYGSKVDWESQHWAFPEYFRNLFYSSHNIFPSFAFNIGAGQNIYYFAYYGLLSPIILLSYLFPLVKMVNYIMVTSILIVIVTYILFYYFLRKNKFSPNISFVVTAIFLCASPLIFHSHRHIMFISFLPMLLLGLIGVDRYFEKNKKFLLTISCFLMIMTSYFYSVGGMFAIAIYGIYKYLSVTKKATIKDFIKAALKFCIPILTAILLAGVLLLPTIEVILSGRADKALNIPIWNYLIPSVNLDNLLYTPYSLGLTAIVVVSLINLFYSKKKQDRFLSCALTLFIIIPVFVYLLNGKLYLDPKCLIPFLPLYCYVIAKFVKDFKENKYQMRFSIVIVLLVMVLALFGSKQAVALGFLADITILMIFLFLSQKNKRPLYVIYILSVSVVLCIIVNCSDLMISKKEYKNSFNETRHKLIVDTIKEDKDHYRFNNQLDKLTTVNNIYDPEYNSTSLYSSTYNVNYNKFYYDIFNVEMPYRNTSVTSSNKNLLFNSFMGVKYVLAKNDQSPYHEVIDESGKIKIYKNNNAFPLGFASSTLYSEKDFYDMGYPYYLDSFFHGITTESRSTEKFKSKIKKYDLDLELLNQEKVEIAKKDIYEVKAEDNGKLKYKINNMPKNSMLLIRFKQLNEPSCKSGDIYIKINGIKNKITCKEWKYANKNMVFDYVISDKEDIDELLVEFSKGYFKIEDIETYVLKYDDIKYDHNFDEFEITSFKGDNLRGVIDVKSDGYFTMTIPYDKGFTAFVDGVKTKVEKVNTSFIGFPIEKGHHDIKITYDAPGQKKGLVLSLIGLIGLTFIVITDYRKKEK